MVKLQLLKYFRTLLCEMDLGNQGFSDGSAISFVYHQWLLAAPYKVSSWTVFFDSLKSILYIIKFTQEVKPGFF